MTVDREVAHHTALDAQLVEAVGGIKLLGLTSWPAALQAPFLASVARGNPVLPQVSYPRLDFSDTRRALAAISAQCDPTHPIGLYVQRSAHSWDLAAGLLEVPVVRNIIPLRAVGNRLELSLEMTTGLAGLNRMLGEDGVLVPVAPVAITLDGDEQNPAPASNEYRLR